MFTNINININAMSYSKTLLIIALSALSGCKLSSGSYPYAEKYKIDCSESELIRAIEEFKGENPQYLVPKEVGLLDGRNNEKDHWYHVYFYYPNENQIVYAWTRPIDNKKTTFAFVSVNDGLILGKWKDINKDFEVRDNKNQKEKFESLILALIKNKVGK
jgi:hypothetical protein